MAKKDPGATWHLKADFGGSGVMVHMAEQDGRFAILVRLDAEGHEPVIFTLTPDQASWLGEALPGALAMLRSWQEQQDWELSMQDPFTAFDNLGGSPVGKDRGDASDDRRADPGLGHGRAAPEEIRDAASQPSTQPAPMPAEGSSSCGDGTGTTSVPPRPGLEFCRRGAIGHGAPGGAGSRAASRAVAAAVRARSENGWRSWRWL